MSSSKQALINALGLEGHVEGGYYRRTFESRQTVMIPAQDQQQSDLTVQRFAATSTYYLLTNDQPIGRWHRNRSDILHFFHAGSPLDYFLIAPNGDYTHIALGSDVAAGHQLHMLVPGGYWKATHLPDGEFGLLSEVVVPGFDFADMELATEETIRKSVTGDNLDHALRFVPHPKHT